MVVLMYFSSQKIKDKTEAEKNQILEIFIPIFEIIFEDFRKVNHDYHNHYATLMMMKSNPEEFSKEEIDAYYEEVESTFDWQVLSNLKSSMLLVLIYSYRVKFNKSGLNLVLDDRVKDEDAFDREYEMLLLLVKVFNILLQNHELSMASNHLEDPENSILISSYVEDDLRKLTVRASGIKFKNAIVDLKEIKKDKAYKFQRVLEISVDESNTLTINISNENQF